MDLPQVLFNDLDWTLALEIFLRTLTMFVLIIALLRLSGKKGVRQLSIFEVSIVIGLGSAAGDPMLHGQNAIVPALIVFATILLFYRTITWLASRSERFETVLEGSPLYVVDEGAFVLHGDRTGYAKDEFFAEMRQQGIEHVGQVKTAILETNGAVSFFFYPDDEVRPGLPVLPRAFDRKSERVDRPGKHACAACAQVRDLDAGAHRCPRCGQAEWVEALSTTRVT